MILSTSQRHAQIINLAPGAATQASRGEVQNPFTELLSRYYRHLPLSFYQKSREKALGTLEIVLRATVFLFFLENVEREGIDRLRTRTGDGSDTGYWPQLFSQGDTLVH